MSADDEGVEQTLSLPMQAGHVAVEHTCRMTRPAGAPADRLKKIAVPTLLTMGGEHEVGAAEFSVLQPARWWRAFRP